MIALLMKRIILQAQNKIGEDRSIFGLYHILQGRVSIQTIQDIKLYRLSHLYGIYKHLERNCFIAFIQSLQKQGFLVEKQPDHFVLSMKGRKWLESEIQTGEQLFFNGQQYRQSDKIFHRLQLLIQVWTNMKMKNNQFIPIIEERETANWVKQFYQQTRTKIDKYLYYLHEELHDLLLGISDYYSEIFVAQLSSYYYIGNTMEQLSFEYSLSKEDIYLMTTNTLHYLIREVQLDESKYPILRIIMNQVEPEKNITHSAKISARFLQQGYKVDEIATRRGLKMNTIHDHIVELMMQEHPSVVLDHYITSEYIATVQNAISVAKSYKLKAIKENVGEEISYFQIRLVLAVLI